MPERIRRSRAGPRTLSSVANQGHRKSAGKPAISAECVGLSCETCRYFGDSTYPNSVCRSTLTPWPSSYGQNKIVLAIIDPLYLALFTAETAGRSGDLYTMGATFEPLTAVCRETGASILLVHHFRKNRGDDQQEPCSLEELSQAGLAEVARWWILLDRREPYAGDGRHALWLRVGGSEGHASFWSLDIDEGLTVDSEGNQRTTKWETTLGRVQDAKAEEKRQRETRKALDLEKREGEHVEKLVVALRKIPAGQTARQLRADPG